MGRTKFELITTSSLRCEKYDILIEWYPPGVLKIISTYLQDLWVTRYRLFWIQWQNYPEFSIPDQRSAAQEAFWDFTIRVFFMPLHVKRWLGSLKFSLRKSSMDGTCILWLCMPLSSTVLSAPGQQTQSNKNATSTRFPASLQQHQVGDLER